MSGPVFVDTNVLVYSRDASEAEKGPRAAAWLESLWRTRLGRVSTQVLHEYYVTVTAKLQPGLDREEAREDVRALRAWRPAPLDEGLLDIAWDLQDSYGFAFWDALIVAAATRLGCDYLLTEDLQEGQSVGALRIISPFAHAPEQI